MSTPAVGAAAIAARHRLTRNRSQHFVSSPRKVASPMKHKHGLGLGRHASKRRRVGSSGVTALEVDVDGDEDAEEAENDDEPAARQRKGKGKERAKAWEPLSSEGGLQRVNRGAEVVDRRGDKGKGRAALVNSHRDVFDESPRKRKRGDAPVVETDDAMEEVEDEGGGAPSIAGSGSWVEIDEDDQDEEEPEFIAESDQHLLADAPAYALQRLKKAELIRLWRVAGMWKEEDDGATVSSTGDDDGLGKKDLVDGLIAARKSASPRQISSLPSPKSHIRAKNFVAESSKQSRSYTNPPSHLPSPSLSPPPPLSHAITPAHGRSRVRVVIEATPKANLRTRSRARPGRKSDGTPHTVGRSAGRQKGSGRNGRIARFGDDVKSPAHGLLARRDTSSLSSIYTTTDGSDVDEAPPRTTRRTRKRGQSQPNRLRSEGEDGTELDGGEETEQDGEATDTDMPEPTPLVARLRSRTKSMVEIPPPPSEPDADDEDEGDEGGDTEEDGDSSPGPSTRTRSQLIASSDSSRSSGREGASLPKRRAKAKALKALRAESSPSLTPDEDEGMEVEQDAEVDGDEGMEEDEDGEELDEEADDGNETEQTETEGPPRDSRYGQAFGGLRSRKRKLRQEARDDPDMEVDDEDEEAEEEEEDMEDASDEGSVAEFDIDLDAATLSSLTRLLRDELVQLCESRGIEVGGTKPQLAKALVEWRDEQNLANESPSSSLSSSSQVTARQTSPKQSSSLSKSKSSRSTHTTKNKIIHAIGSNVHVKGKRTPVLLRDHIHAEDPATPPAPSDEGKQEKDADLNLDLAELGLEDSIILPEHLTKLERIGSGGFKDVYVGKCKGRKVAISEFRSHLSEMDIRELKLLSEFSHPNIVRFKGICIPEDSSQIQCMLVSELCENGDLFDYIRNVGTPSLKRLLGLMLDIARGLEYLHTRRPAIIHRDCKSSNILINRAGQAKVGDFGLARVKTSTRSMIRSLVGTVNWQAPELWHASPRYDYKVDVFSAGLVYWEMMSGWTGEKKYPWEGHNEHYIYDVVGQKSRRPSVAGLRKHWGAEPVNLMERMWHQDPSERPTMSDVVADLEAIIADI